MIGRNYNYLPVNVQSQPLLPQGGSGDGIIEEDEVPLFRVASKSKGTESGSNLLLDALVARGNTNKALFSRIIGEEETPL